MAPEPISHSHISTARESPDWIRSRATSCRGRTGVPGGTSAITPPPEATISSANTAFEKGVERVHPRPDHRPGVPPGRKRALVGDGIDARSQARDDSEARGGCAAGGLIRDASAETTRPACTHNRHCGRRRQRAPDPQCPRGRGDGAKSGRVVPVLDPDGLSGEQPAVGSA